MNQEPCTAVNLLVCHSVHSFRVAAAIARSSLQPTHILFASAIIPKAVHRKTGDCFAVTIIKYERDPLKNIHSLWRFYKSLDVDKLYVSNVSDLCENVLVAMHEGEVILLDDGLAMVTFSVYGSGPFMNTGRSIMRTVRRNLLRIVIRLRFGVWLLNPEQYDSRIEMLVTTFRISSTRYPVTFVSLSSASYSGKSILPRTVYFVGQNCFDLERPETVDLYYSFVCQVRSSYEGDNWRFFYFPHPREAAIPVPLTSCIQRTESSFEEYCEQGEAVPEVVAGIYSTALANLASSTDLMRFEIWELPEGLQNAVGYKAVFRWMMDSGHFLRRSVGCLDEAEISGARSEEN